jgi:hypothetical protein
MPRPILKHSPSSPTTPSYRPHHHPPLAHAAVHFPPSPTLTRTFSAYSSTSYDRSPIVVAPNSCALPERGCPGRTYDLEEASRASAASANWSSRCNKNLLMNDHRHPKAFSRGYTHSVESNGPSAPYNSAPQQAYNPPSVLPSLVHDFSCSSSSESDESDGLHSPPSEHQQFNPYAPYPPRNHVQGLVIPSSSCSSTYSSGYREDGSPSTPTPTPLSFLPHPPSPEDEQRNLASRRRRKRSPNSSGGYTDDRRLKSRSPSSPSSFTLRSSMSALSFNDSDGGCLGGF